MIRGIVMAALAVGVAVGNPALAAPCKDAAGKVIKCPARAAAARTCRVKGKATPCTRNRTQETDTSNRASYKF